MRVLVLLLFLATLSLAWRPSTSCAGDPRINEFMAANGSVLWDGFGVSSDWIELYNPTTSNINLLGWHLTDDAGKLTKWTFPDVTLPAHEYLVLFASGSDTNLGGELHTDFQLSSGGEYLALVAPDGLRVAHAYSPAYPQQYSDVSYGIGPLNDNRYFTNATPHSANQVGAEEFVADTKFDPDRGFYTNPVTITISCATTGALIYFTTDYSQPTTGSTLYTGAISVTRSTCLRAIATAPALYPSDTDTHTYIFFDDVLQQSTNPPGFPASWVGTSADYAMDPQIVSNVLYASRMHDALLSLPSISIVTETEHMFDASTGIYTHPENRGVAWERPVSFEWIDPSGKKGFQINAGLRIYGGAFRSFGLTKKKSFRVLFKAEYGKSKLKASLFEGEGVTTTFDTLVMRGGANDGWNFWGGDGTQFVVDEFMRRTQLAFGQPSSHGTFTHLYINGLYWGMYNLVERPDAAFSSTYFGGTENDWDGINAGDPTGESNLQTWNEMLAQIRATPIDNVKYQKLQGNNPDRTVNNSYADLLDIENYIDYMLVNFWGGTGDWPGHNYYVGCRKPPTSTGFKSYCWDAEGAIGLWSNLNTDNTGVNNGLGEPYNSLRQNAEFRLQFGDHIQRHLFNGGAATPSVVSNRYREVTTLIEDAVVAESARWGDMRSGTLRTPATWENTRAYIQNTYMPFRTGVALTKLRAAGLFPSIDAPVFSQYGGLFTNGTALSISAAHPVYYTLDGSDPREYGTSSAIGTLYTTPLTLTHAVRVKARALSGGTTWSALSETTLTPDTPSTLRLTEIMYHPRSPTGAETNVAAGSGAFEYIEFQNRGVATLGLAGLRLVGGVTFDFSQSATSTLEPDAFVLIVRDLRAFKVRYPDWSSLNIAGEFQSFDSFPIQNLSDAGEALILRDAQGSNIVSVTYNDARDWPQSADGAGHSLVPTELTMQSGGELDYSAHWRASAFLDGSPGQADPILPQTLVLNEILAHTDLDDPLYPDYDSNDGIELYNTSASSISLNHWYLSDDPSVLTKWAIPGNLAVAANAWHWFEEILDFHAPITNGFGLSKDGETVYLSYLPGGVSNRVVDAYRFKGQLNGISVGRFPDGAPGWFALSPTTNAANAVPLPHVLFSEVMYHPAPAATQSIDVADLEYIEILNPTDQAVPLWTAAGTWRIDGGVSFVFPTNLLLGAHAYALIVPFDPLNDTVARINFNATYSLTNGQVRMLGPYKGQLNNGTERIALEMPQEADAPSTQVSWVLVDELVYYDRLPWPVEADGSGSPLQRVLTPNSGLSPESWFNGFVGTPGTPGTPLAIVTPHHGTRYFCPADEAITIAFDAQQVSGQVHSVTFFDGSNVICVATQAPYACVLPMPDPRPYAITAHLLYDGGLITARQSVVTALLPETLPPKDIREESAILCGFLHGGDEANLAFYYGTSDGGSNPFAWDAFKQVAFPGQGHIELAVSDLSPNTTYYARMQGSADGHSGISTGVVMFTTTSFAAWQYAMQLSFGGAGAETLTNFPVLIRLHPGLTGFSYDQFASPDGNDLRFSGASLSQRLSYEIQEWNPAGTSTVWVAVKSLNSNSVIHAHWGYDQGTNAPPPYALDGSTWASPYSSVWHFETALTDATLRYPGIWPPSASPAAGIVGQALHFNGAGTTVTNGPPPSWYEDNMNGLTLSLWVRPNSPVNQYYATVFGFKGSGGGRFFIDMDPTPWLRRWRVGLDTTTHLVDLYQLAAWQYLAMVLNDGKLWFALNGGPFHEVAGYTPFTPAGRLTTGGGISPSVYFSGDVDEMRMTRTARSGAWLRAEYATVALHNTFTQYSAVQSHDPDQDEDGIPDAWEQRYSAGTNMDPEEHDDNDGLSNVDEYISGTDPTNSASVFMLDIFRSNASPVLRLFGIDAIGPGYEGLERFYALEYLQDLTGTNWIGVQGMTNVPGRDQWIIHTNSPPGNRYLYRARTRLAPRVP